MRTLIGYFLRQLFVYTLLCMGTFLMLRSILPYTAFKDTIGFLQFKQDYVHLWWWNTAFYIHVFSAVLALMAGFTQFNRNLLASRRGLHRWIGRIYAYDILFINVPAGLVLAVCANGGWPGKLAFLVLDSLWFIFTYIAVAAVRQGDLSRHRAFMIRSYAMTFSAIMLRTWKIVFSHTLQIDPVMLYQIDAWMAFAPNLLFAEWWLRRSARGRTHFLTAQISHYSGSINK
ncbi:MAG: DUF2306 domain-containing protein [Puia sp.]|nr:DUF2306 domain-containing protein [Puia sp.]